MGLEREIGLTHLRAKHATGFHQCLTGVWGDYVCIEEAFLYPLPREVTTAFRFLTKDVFL